MRRLAPAVWAATMTVVAIALALPRLTGAPSGLDGYVNWPDVLLIAVIDTALGAFIVGRRPRHPVGWLILVGGGVASALQLLTGVYSELGPTVAHVAVAALLAALLQFVGVMSFVVLFHLFPTGRPVSPRWRLPFGPRWPASPWRPSG